MAKDFKIFTRFESVDHVSRTTKNIKRSVHSMVASGVRDLNKMHRATGMLSRGITRLGVVSIAAATAAAYTLARALTAVAVAGMDIESSTAGFISMVGGLKQAEELTDKLHKAAAQTPFEFEGLAKVTSGLLPIMNGDLEKTVSTMAMLSDTARGSQDILERVAKGFTKAALKTRVDMESMWIIQEAGVNVFADLMDIVGAKTKATFFKMVSAGKVTASQLEEAFKRITGPGGMYHKGAENLMNTTRGMLSTLRTEIKFAVSDIWTGIKDPLKLFITKVIETVQSLQGWIRANREVIQEKLLVFIEKLNSKFDQFVQYIKDLEAQKPIIDRIVNGITAIGDALTWVWRNKDAITALVVGIYAVNFALGVLTGTMLILDALTGGLIPLIGLGISALVGMIAIVWFKWEEITSTMADWWGSWSKMIQREMRSIINWIMAWPDAFLNVMNHILDSVSNMWDNFWSGADKNFETFKRGISGGKVSLGVDVSGGQARGLIGAGIRTSSLPVANYVVSPEQRNTEYFQQTNNAAVTIRVKDDTGRAEVEEDSGVSTQTMDLQVERTGGF